ncbi:hypothetical protein C6A36_00850, partial [Desulfobacteraceae bacterium SEEP-SAG10]
PRLNPLRLASAKHLTGQAEGRGRPGEIRFTRHLREFHWVKKMGLEEYPAEYYEELLEYVKDRYEGQYWHVLPKEMARFWRNRVPKVS